jgi:hypothetical protein
VDTREDNGQEGMEEATAPPSEPAEETAAPETADQAHPGEGSDDDSVSAEGGGEAEAGDLAAGTEGTGAINEEPARLREEAARLHEAALSRQAAAAELREEAARLREEAAALREQSPQLLEEAARLREETHAAAADIGGEPSEEEQETGRGLFRRRRRRG